MMINVVLYVSLSSVTWHLDGRRILHLFCWPLLHKSQTARRQQSRNSRIRRLWGVIMGVLEMTINVFLYVSLSSVTWHLDGRRILHLFCWPLVHKSRTARRQQSRNCRIRRLWGVIMGVLEMMINIFLYVSLSSVTWHLDGRRILHLFCWPLLHKIRTARRQQSRNCRMRL